MPKSTKKHKRQLDAVDTAADIMARLRAKHGIGTPSTQRLEKVIESGAKVSESNRKKTVKRLADEAITKSKPVAAKPKAEPPAPKPSKELPLCACGCGGRTKGGTYLPGHDSKHRSALAGPKELPLCGCGCGARTRGGRFLPGHDAKFHSAQKKAEKEAAEKKEQAKAA